jgi:hypothetical protein
MSEEVTAIIKSIDRLNNTADSITTYMVEMTKSIVDLETSLAYYLTLIADRLDRRNTGFIMEVNHEGEYNYQVEEKK